MTVLLPLRGVERLREEHPHDIAARDPKPRVRGHEPLGVAVESFDERAGKTERRDLHRRGSFGRHGKQGR